MGLNNITENRALVVSTKEYATLQLASRARDKSAYQIMQDSARYEKAIEIYQIDINKLKKQAGRHNLFGRVNDDAEFYNTKSVIQNDQLTFEYHDVQIAEHEQLFEHLSSHEKSFPATQSTQKFVLPVETSENQESTFKSLLNKYVNMELEQTRLVKAMHAARSKDPKAGKELSAKMLAHAGEIKTFAAAALQHTDIKVRIDEIKNIRPESLAQRGGFIAIRDRISKGEWLKNDIQTVLLQMRGKAQDQSRSRAENRERGRGGGRSR